MNPELNEFPPNILEIALKRTVGFNKALGLRFVRATPHEVVHEITVSEHHHQAMGIVHGGVYAAMIETACSNGAALTVLSQGKTTVGLENSTSFLRAVRQGTLRCVASHAFIGKRSLVWEAKIHDDQVRLVATGRVRLVVLEPGVKAGGIPLGFQESAE